MFFAHTSINAKTIEMDKITIYQFTDPICVWCWGNEPTMRAIDYLYGSKIGVEYVMGGLIEEITTLYELKGSTREIIDQANNRIAENWVKASERHGMPVNTRHFALFSERYPSSFPQNIAYEAARLIDPEVAKRFLRRIREATFIEARRTSQMDVLVELAVEIGLEAALFIDAYTSGDAQSNFTQSRMKCRRNGITGFPSYVIKCGSTKITLNGYQNLSTFHAIIGRLSEGRIKPRRLGPSQANIIDFMRRYRSVYPVEIEVAFGLDKPRTDLMINELERSNKLSIENVGNGCRLTLSDSARTPRTDRRGKVSATSQGDATKNTNSSNKQASDVEKMQ